MGPRGRKILIILQVSWSPSGRGTLGKKKIKNTCIRPVLVIFVLKCLLLKNFNLLEVCKQATLTNILKTIKILLLLVLFHILQTPLRGRQSLGIRAHNLFQNNGKRNLFSQNWSDNRDVNNVLTFARLQTLYREVCFTDNFMSDIWSGTNEKVAGPACQSFAWSCA